MEFSPRVIFWSVSTQILNFGQLITISYLKLVSQELRAGGMSKAKVKYYVLKKVAGIAVTPSTFNECYQRARYTLGPLGEI